MCTQIYSAEILNNVLIISIDALHPNAVTAENAPNIHRFSEKGVVVLDGKSTTPPKTLVSHSAMFTGIPPENGGMKENVWETGDSTVDVPTIFDKAKDKGYSTAFVYSKKKLGFLVNNAIDKVMFSKEYPIDETHEYMSSHDKTFVFLHISGLDITGPQYGWMSDEYIEDFKFIDEELNPLINTVQRKGKYLIIITSDHAGHDKKHGCGHPDDYRLPFIAFSDVLSPDAPVLVKYETFKLIKYLQQIHVF